MYKVFIENKAVLFISNREDIPKDSAVYLCEPDETSYRSLRSIRTKLKKDILVIVLTANEKIAWKKFKSELEIVKAAGGLVENSNGEFLLIYRNGRWDLPKGKLKKKEGKKKGAKREIEEECGIDGLSIVRKITKSYHVINRAEKDILKKVFWYKFTSNFQGELKPQLEEGITKVKWFPKEKALKKLKDTWGTVSEVAIVELAEVDSNSSDGSKNDEVEK